MISQVGSYSYLPAHPHAVVTAGINSYSYDSNGNMTGRNSAPQTFDYDNRLSSLVNSGTTTDLPPGFIPIANGDFRQHFVPRV